MTVPDRRVRALVVEDREDIAENLRTLLGHWGCKVRVARDGLAGLAQARWFWPDVALIGLSLPGLEGLDLGYILSRLPNPSRPVLVAAAGRDSPDTHREAWEAGFDYYLPEPINRDRLRAILESVSLAGRPLVGVVS